MNQKAYSVLFCALLASTFVHELKAKGVAPVSSRLQVFERAAPSEICELECHFSGSLNVSLGLSVQVVENVLVIANLSSNAAFLIDVTAQIVVVLNGTSGAGVALNLSTKTGVYVSSGLWVSAQLSISKYISSLSGGLKFIFSISGAVSFSFTSISSVALTVINEILVQLIVNISEEIKQNAQIGFQVIVAIGGSIVVLFQGSLSGILSVFGSAVINISNDLAGFFNVLQGFASIVVQLGGSLSALIEKGVVFDLIVIFQGSSGVEVLINIILQVGLFIDIGGALGNVLNSAESFFKLVAQLGGNSSIGISGVFLVVANIVALINKNATLEVVISGIIQFVAYSSVYVKGDLSAQLNATLVAFLEVIEHVNATAKLSGLVSIVKSLVAGTLIIGGVNISVIISKLLAGAIVGASNLLVVVTWVVLQLKAAVQIGILLPYLLLVLIFKLNSAIGLAQLIALGIQVSVSLEAIKAGIFKTVLQNVISIILNGLFGNFYNVLIKLSIVGTVVLALNASVEASSNGEYSLSALLNASSQVKNLILGLFQSALAISLGIASSVIAQVNTIYAATSSFSACIHVSFSSSVSVGG